MTNVRGVTLCGRQLPHPTHICAFFDSRDEEYEVLVPYYREGLKAGEEVITIVESSRLPDHRDRLRSAGIHLERSIEPGELRVLTSEETYTKGGRFGAERMYLLLQGALADAQHAGRKVRTSGVMDWATRGHAGTEELMDYEARLNVLVPLYDCTLLCVHDLNELSGTMVMDILRTHEYVIHRREVLVNPCYVPPIEMLKGIILGEMPETTTAAAIAS
jgi:hypothetical protein